MLDSSISQTFMPHPKTHKHTHTHCIFKLLFVQTAFLNVHYLSKFFCKKNQFVQQIFLNVLKEVSYATTAAFIWLKISKISNFSKIINYNINNIV